MSFILIAPEGWVPLDTEYYENNTDMTKAFIANAAQQTVIEYITPILLERGDLQPQQMVVEIKVIDDNFWMLISE